ncbi:8149_t:CDS:2, partial [Ambispora leptoticha]
NEVTSTSPTPEIDSSIEIEDTFNKSFHKENKTFQIEFKDIDPEDYNGVSLEDAYNDLQYLETVK